MCARTKLHPRPQLLRQNVPIVVLITQNLWIILQLAIGLFTFTVCAFLPRHTIYSICIFNLLPPLSINGQQLCVVQMGVNFFPNSCFCFFFLVRVVILLLLKIWDFHYFGEGYHWVGHLFWSCNSFYYRFIFHFQKETRIQ